jgi:hypothetical protein
MQKQMVPALTLLSTKFGKFVLIATAASLVGCASTTQRILPSSHTLGSFKPDCTIAKEQVEWLRSIRPTLHERRDAYLEVTSWGGFSKEFAKNKEIADGRIDYLINANIDEIYYRCNFRHKSY